MFQPAETPNELAVDTRLDAALAALERALGQAGSAAADIRAVLPQVAGLSGLVSDLERAMGRAREELSVPSRAGAPATLLSPVRPIPIERDTGAPFLHPEAAQPPGKPGTSLRIEVRVKQGSLDLKAVESAVSEHTDATDLTLLDYDGREAVFKVSTPVEEVEYLRDALAESLRHHVGAAEDAEIAVEVLGESA